MLLSQDSIRAPIKPRHLRAKVQSSSEHNADGSGAGNTRRRNFLLSTRRCAAAKLYMYLRFVISHLSPSRHENVFFVEKWLKDRGLVKGTVLFLFFTASLALSLSERRRKTLFNATLTLFAPFSIYQKFHVIQRYATFTARRKTRSTIQFLHL